MRFSLLPSLDEKKAQVAKLDSRAITMAREPPRRRTDLRLPRQGALAFCRADGYARERRDVKSRHLGEGIKPTKREFLRRFSSDPRHRVIVSRVRLLLSGGMYGEERMVIEAFSEFSVYVTMWEYTLDMEYYEELDEFLCDYFYYLFMEEFFSEFRKL